MKDGISCHDPVEGQNQRNFNQGGSYTIFARLTAPNQLHVDFVDTGSLFLLKRIFDGFFV